MDHNILQKAIDKAISNGWTYLGIPENGWGIDTGQWSTTPYGLMINSHKFGDHYINLNEIIYNHDFARSIWGGSDPESEGVLITFRNESIPAWQYHLQRMVIADDPIAYLGEHL